MGTPIDAARAAIIRDGIERGLTDRAIARAARVGHVTVGNHRRRAGISPRPRAVRPVDWTPFALAYRATLAVCIRPRWPTTVLAESLGL